MREQNRNGRTVGFFVAGGLIGAGLALLFAPQSGRKTRRDLKHLGKVAMNKSEAIRLDLQHSIDNAANTIAERLSEEIDAAREWTESSKNQLLNALESGKNFLRGEIEKVTRA